MDGEQRQREQVVRALSGSGKHSWVGIGGKVAHCQGCRIGHTPEAELTSCEGTCICRHCGHHIDAHPYGAPGDTCRGHEMVVGGCTCQKFERGVAVWDPGRGWVLAGKVA